jgi:hypothetical protein
MTKAVGTALWMSPEVFCGNTSYGPAVDVVSGPPPPSLVSASLHQCRFIFSRCHMVAHVLTVHLQYSYGIILWELATRKSPW